MMSVPSREDLAEVEPQVARRVFRSGAYFMGSTSGMCRGHVQTNLLGLDKTLAEDFAKFCSANWGPLPLLYKSDAGQYTAPGITQTDSDVRTDLPAYNVLQDGVVINVVENLLDFSEALKDCVFFYIGCSFSFDATLLAAGVPLRNLEQKCYVCQYKTNVECYPVGPFQCKMVVSLRPIPRHLVETTFKATQPFSDCHGAPVHIGDPALIGITDIEKPEYCSPMKFEEGDVPVFWACGTTVVDTVKAVKPSLAFAHYEKDGVYISDRLVQNQDAPRADIKVITLCEKPYWASVTSEAVVEKFKQLEGFMGNGQLGTVVHNDLLKSVLALSHASLVALTIGFPHLLNNENIHEDCGLSGAIVLAIMLQVLGKKVDLVVNKMLRGPLTTMVEALVEQKVLAKPVSVVQFPAEGEQDTLETAKRFLLKAGTTTPRYDHLLAIERTGKAEDGGSYTINGERLGSGIGWLFQAAAEVPTVHTSSIQDGNKNLDMGKVNGSAHIDIQSDPSTACSMVSNFLITSEVSNWGGYAVAVGLYLVSICPIHERYRRKAVGFPPSEEDRQRYQRALPNTDRERQILQILNKSRGNGLSVEDVNAKIKQLRSIIGEE